MLMNSSDANVQFAIYVSGEVDGDIEAWKVYRVLPDEAAIAVGCRRVIDESGEDYLYAKEQFVLVDLPEAARSQLLAAIAPSRAPLNNPCRSQLQLLQRLSWQGWEV
jgi:hypothetical protein